MKLQTCVTPTGDFIYGVHRPAYRVLNLREGDGIKPLGSLVDGGLYDNRANFPTGDVMVSESTWVYEIPNAFPFRGVTYIGKDWADAGTAPPAAMAIPPSSPASVSEVLRKYLLKDGGPDDFSSSLAKVFESLPEAVHLALAVNSTDPADLQRLADMCCEFEFDDSGGVRKPVGLKYRRNDSGLVRAVIKNHCLFEALVNNYYLPDAYKKVMVLRPGAQGDSEITGEWSAASSEEGAAASHVFEYLRGNSYIPWGHYAANMADDEVRYRIADLTVVDMKALRHLYYQRTYVRVAAQLGLPLSVRRKRLAVEELEALRKGIAVELADPQKRAALQFTGTLWGWNYGFDFAPSRYRLNASHQQIHQQYALIPATVATCRCGESASSSEIASYGCGDLVAAFIQEYKRENGTNFFDNYIKAIRNNRRIDGNDHHESSLIVYEDENVMAFVPKAQTSQWELQLMTIKPVGNILEADTATRNSLDRAMLLVMRILASLGVEMVATIEYAKRFAGSDIEQLADQRLLYSFLPKLPDSPGAFSEAQLRWIMGHYPEDFAVACREKLSNVQVL